MNDYDLDSYIGSLDYSLFSHLATQFERVLFALSKTGDVEISYEHNKSSSTLSFLVTDIRTCRSDIFRVDLKISSYGKLISKRTYKKTPSLGF